MTLDHAPALTGEVVQPGDDAYAGLRGTLVRVGSPAYVVRCRDAAEVAAAVRFARREGLTLSVRSGGHSTAGFGTNDGGLVVDVSPIDGVEVIGGPDDLVRIGTGARWGEVARALAPYGLVLSSGDTASVGVGGLLLGGGIGWLVRKHGLALDHLVAAEVVTADGRVLRASADENADLFWAVRGGGGNFGVVTSFEVSARRQGDVTVARVAYPASEAAQVLRAWRDVVRSVGDDLTSTAHLFPAFGDDAPATLMITSCYAGDDPAAVEPLTRLGTALSKDVATVPYAEVLEEISELPPGWRPIVRNRFARSLDDALIDTVTAHAGDVPMTVFEIRMIGGAMNRVPSDATAFAHRDAEIMLTTVVLGGPAEHAPILGDFEALWRRLAPHTSGAYVNFLSDIAPGDLAAVYPAGTYERLVAVKRAYDPGNVFDQNLNVSPDA
ncbi:FAD-binding oxidoreductase [Microbispora corallina]|uniref:Oxidoreductase n=1 Tax=Microbispora corallina TaxID=83302 RepID=A0ABQ4FWR5_9ACTN|nr:FAD-binding oxidoreductase [Microbispora corallina]GIH39247.1 oxidoreductase [Microbispora corallina]